MSRRIQSEVLDEQLRVSLADMCRLCGVHAEYLMALVDEGIITPAPDVGRGRATRRRGNAGRGTMQRWQFDGLAVVRVQRVVRLQRDLGVNLPGAALALELLDELENLRRRG